MVVPERQPSSPRAKLPGHLERELLAAAELPGSERESELMRLGTSHPEHAALIGLLGGLGEFADDSAPIDPELTDEDRVEKESERIAIVDSLRALH